MDELVDELVDEAAVLVVSLEELTTTGWFAGIFLVFFLVAFFLDFFTFAAFFSFSFFFERVSIIIRSRCYSYGRGRVF